MADVITKIAIPGEPPNWVYTMFALSCSVLVSIPFWWHLEAWNTGTCLFMAWAGLGCFIGGVNSIIWNDNVMNVAPVWCDISTRFWIGMSVGIPAASLCINRRLYIIATIQSVTSSKRDKQRAVVTDLAIGLGIPFLQMILEIIVQGHRFNIFEEIGCFPATYNTPPAYPLVFCWPVAISLVSAVYCSLAIRAFLKRRAAFKEILSSNNNLSSSRYFRLMGLAAFELCLGIPWSTYGSLYLNIHAAGQSESPINPYINWANVHYHFGYIGQFPVVEWKQSEITVLSLELARWSTIICSFIFFGFFGFAQEARKHYRLAFNSVAKKVGYTTLGFSSGESSSFSGTKPPTMSITGRGTLPVFIRQETTSKRDSCASFSTNLTLGDVGGTLDDVKEPYSPINSASGASSTYSHDRKDVSPSHPPALSPPEPTLDVHSPPIVTRPDSNIV